MTRVLLATNGGAVGDQGPEGPQGPVGPAGADGTKARTATVGPVGPQGPAGPAGADGIKARTARLGPEGPQGPAGPAGADGTNGTDGAVGPEGPQGPAGPAGADGTNGTDGAVGPEGPQGPAGPAGADGTCRRRTARLVNPQGPAGPAGADGTIKAGRRGWSRRPSRPRWSCWRRRPNRHGRRGWSRGPQGPAGPAGADGTTTDGAVGPEGPQGPAGPAGADGADGADGVTLTDLLYGDGSAGDLFITADESWDIASGGTGGILNTNFRDCYIAPSRPAPSAPSGTVIRCTGIFLNEGTITVSNWVAGAGSPVYSDSVNTVAGNTATVPTTFNGGRPLSADALIQLYAPGFEGFGNGARGGGGPDNDSGGAGGTLRLHVRGTLQNLGTINASGGDALPQGTSGRSAGSGGGGGGIVVLVTEAGFGNFSGQVLVPGGVGSDNSPGRHRSRRRRRWRRRRVPHRHRRCAGRIWQHRREWRSRGHAAERHRRSRKWRRWWRRRWCRWCRRHHLRRILYVGRRDGSPGRVFVLEGVPVFR